MRFHRRSFALRTRKRLGKILRNPTVALNMLNSLLVRRVKGTIDLEEERTRSFTIMSSAFGLDVRPLYEQLLESDFRQWWVDQKQHLIQLIGSGDSSSLFDCETLYLLIRCVEPQVVLETGVLYGASSAFILKALGDNGLGRLYSFDLPNDDGMPGQDSFVPEALAARWELILGDSRRELPELLDQVASVDMFFHDGLHTFQNMYWEYETIAARLSPGGVIASHDVLLRLPFHRPFQSFCGDTDRPYAVVRNLGFTLPQ